MNLYLEKDCPLRRNGHYNLSLKKLLTKLRSKSTDQRNGSGTLAMLYW